MKTTLSSKGQIVLPADLREQDAIEPGQQFSIERVAPGKYVLEKLTVPERSGIAAWLARCPEHDWFEPIPSESTDTL